jgi:hypothetical protein
MSQKKTDGLKSICAGGAVIAGTAAMAYGMGKVGKKVSLKAGVGKRNITSNQATGMMDDVAMKAALGVSDAKHKGVRVNDPLMAKALVMEDGGTKFVMIAMDVIAIGGIGELSDSESAAIIKGSAEALGISEDNVMVNSSHTHLVGGQLSDDVVTLTIEAVKDAAANMEPVKVGAGKGFENTIAMNRRLRLKNGKHWAIRHANPCPPDDEVVGIGPMDPEVGILRVDRMDGRPLAIVYNYACHPYLGVPAKGVSGEFPAYASEVIEKKYEGCMALFIQGAGGDMTEVLYKDVNRERDCRPLGRALGRATVEAAEKIETKEGSLKVISTRMDLPGRKDFDEKFAELDAEEKKLAKSLAGTSLNCETFVPLYVKYNLDKETPAYYSYRYLQEKEQGIEGLAQMDAEQRRNIAKYMRNLHVMEKLTRIQANRALLLDNQNKLGGRDKVRCHVQAIKIGDFHMVTFPAEVLVGVGLNIKEQSSKPNTFFAGFSNGYIQYAGLASEYDCDAEENYDSLLAREWEPIFMKKALGMLDEL